MRSSTNFCFQRTKKQRCDFIPASGMGLDGVSKLWSRSEGGQAGSVPVRPGGSGTSSWDRMIFVDHQALARCKCHFSPIVVVCDLSFTMFLKWSGGMAVRRRCPLLELCRDPRACPPVVVWLDAPCPPPGAPDTAPEFSDCLERGVDDHNSVHNDGGGILEW
jgi:hypothetical protein